jgi:peptidyl-prolyl cis-trans isomerase C
MESSLSSRARPSSRWARSARHASAAALGVLAALVPLGPGHEPQAATSPVVARVGGMTITAADLERRISAIPPFQLKSFGATGAEIRRTFLDRVMVREALLSLAATDRGLEARDDVRERMRGVLRSAMLNHLRGEVANGPKIADADVRAYYDQNTARFHTPERYAVWLIATRHREEAVEILAEIKKDPTPKKWAEIARQKSIDPPSALRGGNLGFVSPDGTTPEPGVKLGKAVVEATQHLKDSEMTSEPIKDGDRWVLVWRKQTMASVERSVESEAASIRQILVHARTDAKIKETIARLRKDELGDHNPDLIDLFDITPQGDLTPVRRPGSLPAGRHIAATPVPGPNGR